MRSADLLDHEISVALVGQHLVHQGAGVRIDERRDLSVEISRETIPDVGQDQTFQPVLGLGVRMKFIERSVERLHRRHDICVELGQARPYRSKCAI